MTNETVAAICLSLFVLLLTVAAVTTGARVIYLKRHNQPLPTLLIRDVIVKTSLSWAFLSIAIVRAFGLGPLVAGHVWWTLLTSIPPIFGAAVYVYYELFVIGRRT
jgi:hypothetical protein